MPLPNELPHDVHHGNLKDSLKQRSDLHVSRKIWHCIGIVAMAVGYATLSIRTNWMILLLISTFFIPLDFLRQKNPGLNKATLRLFGPLMRRHEFHRVSGMTYLFIGCFFLLTMNHRHVVTLTLLFLAFGDPFASYFGLRYGKDRILGTKTLQGTMAAFTICSLIAALYYYFNNLMIERLLIVAPLSGLIGAVAELIPIGKLDDNLTFPIVGSTMLWILFHIYGG